MSVCHGKGTTGSGVGLGLCCAVTLALPGQALAEAERPAPSPVAEAASQRSGGWGDVHLSVGGARAEYALRDFTRAEFSAMSIDAGVRFGGFANEHLLLGYDLVVGHHIRVGDFVAKPGAFSGEPRPKRHDYTVFAPLGLFFQVYPLSGHGVYLGASGGVGFMFMPGYAEGEILLAQFAFDLGYDLSGTGIPRLGAFARYQRWIGAAFLDTDSVIDSHGVNIGARWSLF